MRILSLMFIGALGFSSLGHACEGLLGHHLKPEDLRPHMIVRVHPTSSYLEFMNAEGVMIVQGVQFKTNDTVLIDLLPIGAYVPNTEGRPLTLTYAYHLGAGTGESASFEVIGYADSLGGHVSNVVVTDPEG